VKEKTVKAVHKAIEELGFERNISAANLARNRVYRFAYFLPKGDGEFLNELKAQVETLGSALRLDSTQISIRQIIGNDQHKIVEHLAKVSIDQFDGIAILAPEGPQVRDALTRVAERGVHVVRLISDQQSEYRQDFVGIDNTAAGRTAARLLGSFSGRKSGNVLVVTDTMLSPDSVSRRAGFDQTLQSRFPNLNTLPTLETYGDKERTAKVLRSAIDNFPDLAGVYVMSSEAGFVLDSLALSVAGKDLAVIAHERTENTLTHLKSGLVDALIVQDAGHVVRSAARKLRARCDKRKSVATQDSIRIEVLLLENCPT
jgi:LacI family transcriptional regulator